MKKLALLVLVVLIAGTTWVAHQLRTRPSIERYATIELPQARTNQGLRVTFLGVSTLLLRDGTANILIDGFFSRPDLYATALQKIGPDPRRIANALALAKISKLDAVITVHSHYDHAMDAPQVAARTGALLIGSESTANIARGQVLPEERIRVVNGTETFRFGVLSVTLIPSEHFPHGKAMGELTSPLIPPARALEYLDGGSFSVLVERDDQSVLIQSSAGYVEGALAGRHADVVYLGVGLLGSKDDAYREAYWKETVTAVGAKRVVPIHWDDFTRELDQPLVALPYLLDDLDTSMDFVFRAAKRDLVDVRWPVLWRVSDPFAGLAVAPLPEPS